MKVVGSRSFLFYVGICEVHKAIVDVRSPFKPILSAIEIVKCKICKIAKFLLPMLSCLTINEFTLKTSWSAKEIVEKDSGFYMGSLDVGSLFNNIPFEETINICTESTYNQNHIVEGLNESKFKELLFLAPKKSYFIFNEYLYKQIDCLAMGSSLRLTLANHFLCFSWKK